MPKHINKLRQALRRVIGKRTQRALDSREKRRARRRLGASGYRREILPDVSHLLQRSRLPRYVPFEIPEELHLFKGFEVVANTLQEIRRIATRQRRQVILNFENTKKIDPAALLVLLAEIYRSRRIEPGAAAVTGTYPSDPKLERMLQDTGFFNLLGVKSRLPNEDRSFPLEWIKFETGTQAVGEAAEALQKALFGQAVAMDPAASQRLYRGLTEAMTNVVQHAYPDPDRNLPKLRNRWWMVGHINKWQKQLTVMICDQGVGIPKTLPKNYPMELINGALSMLRIAEPSDGEYIRAAMEIGKSKTKLAHRGRGLADFRGFVDRAGAGSLRILSNRGSYEYFPNGKEAVANSRHSLGGTFIQWRVPLASISNLDDGAQDG